MADEELKVTVPASIAITAENDASYANTATVEMDFHTFYRAGLNLDTYTAVNGSVSFNETKADTYKGSVNFKVALEQTTKLVRTIDVGEVADTVTASLYDNGDLVVSGNGTIKGTGLTRNFLNEYASSETTLATNKIIIEEGINLPANSASLFASFINANKIEGLDKVDVSNVTDMSWMFSRATITDIAPLVNWNVSNVTNMRYMFESTPITDLAPLTNWKVSNVTDMGYMFTEAPITDLAPLTNWDVSNVTNIRRMFANIPSTVALPTWCTADRYCQ